METRSKKKVAPACVALYITEDGKPARIKYVEGPTPEEAVSRFLETKKGTEYEPMGPIYTLPPGTTHVIFLDPPK